MPEFISDAFWFRNARYGNNLNWSYLYLANIDDTATILKGLKLLVNALLLPQMPIDEYSGGSSIKFKNAIIYLSFHGGNVIEVTKLSYPVG